MLPCKTPVIQTYYMGYYGLPDVVVRLVDEEMGDYDESPLRWYDNKKHVWKFGNVVIPRRICFGIVLWAFLHSTVKECELLYSQSRKEYLYKDEQKLTDIDKCLLKIFNKKYREKDPLSCNEASLLCSKIAETLNSDISKDAATEIRNLARRFYSIADEKAKNKISPELVLEDL